MKTYTKAIAAMVMLTSALAAHARPLPDGLVEGDSLLQAGKWQKARLKDGGLHVSLSLPAKRAGFYKADWAPMTLSEARDVRGFTGVVMTVETDQPRTDAWVDLALMEEDGSWYYIRDAVPLSAKRNVAAVDFGNARLAEFVINSDGTRNGMDGMFDEDFHLDTKSIKRIAVGAVNGFGAGMVSFKVTGMKLATWPRPGGAVEGRETVRVRVTGRTLKVNDTSKIPSGMFGYHIAGGDVSLVRHLRPGSIRPIKAMAPGGAYVKGPDPENNIDFYVCCQYDRMPNQMLFPMKRGDWKSICTSVGKKIGKMARPYGKAAVIEWWNEPYLAFGAYLEKDPGSWLRTDNIREGDAAVTKYGRKLKSFVWMDAKGQNEIPRPWHTGEGKPLKAYDGLSRDGKPMKLVARDPSRYDYFAGRQIAHFYIDTFNAMAKEARKGAPDVQLIGGYGFRWHEDEWGAWELLMKPLIDSSIEHLDGVNEHHYHCDVTQMPGAYEVLQAYTDTKYGKRLKSYNTETNNLWDAPAMGSPVFDKEKALAYRSKRRMVFQVRDIIYTLHMTPDKVAARAIHALWRGSGGAAPTPGANGTMDGQNRVGLDAGEYLAMYLMRDLRGSMVDAQSPSDDVWVVSSIDEETNSLVTVIYNDGPDGVVVEPQFTAPAKTRLVAGAVEFIESGRDGAVRLVEAGKVSVPDDERQVSLRFGMPPNSARRVSLKLKGTWPTEPQVRRRQFFCEGILNQIEPGKEVTLPIKLPTNASKAKKTWLRVVLERCGDGEGYIKLGGRTIAMPAAYTPAMVPAIREIAVDPSVLAGTKSITFGAADASVGNGYLLCAASVFVEEAEE